MTTTGETEVLGEAIIRRPLMSGHCVIGNEAGHERCQRNGGGQRANPAREFQPCPCLCHYVNDEGAVEVLECGTCGEEIVECAYWPRDGDGDVRYAHVDLDADRVTGEECTRKPVVSRNEPEPEDAPKHCIRCGDLFIDTVGGRVCPGCIKTEQEERDAADDFSDLDDDDDFADLDNL